MRCNNKYILKRSNEGGKLVGGLLSYVKTKLRIIDTKTLRRVGYKHSQYKENMVSLNM